MVDIMVPLAQQADHLLFVDARGLLRKSPVNEVNLGVGYRWLNDDADAMMGVYAYYDYKQSAQKLKYSQLTLGGEYKFGDWSFGSNVYVPLDTSKREISNTPLGEAQKYQGDKFTVMYGDNIITEYALYGIDAEVGYTLPKLPELTAYLGGYYFKHSDSRTIAGPRAALQYDVAPLLGKAFDWVGSLSLETSMQYDAVRNGIFYAGVRLTVPLGSDVKRATGLQKAMTAFVRRDLDVVTDKETTFENQKLWTKPDGTPYVGKIVTDQAGIAAATTAGSGIDIIGVKGQVAVTGPAFVDSTTEAAVVFLQGQSITGLTYTFTTGGKTYNTKIVNSRNGISGADASITTRGGLTLQGNNGEVGSLIRVYTENDASVDKTKTQRIEDLVLRVPEAASNAEQTSAVITNVTGQVDAEGNQNSFGDVVIDNIDANGIISFYTDTNRSGQITVQNSQLNVTNSSKYYGVIDLNSEAEGDLKIIGITNNDIASSSAVGNSLGIYADWLNGPVTGNRFGVIAATGVNQPAYGIVGTNLTGTVSNNTFSSLSGAGDVTGIGANNLSGTVSDNTFSTISAGGNAHAIGSVNFTGTVSNNTFSSISAGGDAYGIIISGDFTAGTVSNNTFSNITGTTNAYGFYAGTSFTGSLTGNTFNVSATVAGNAIGISLPNGTNANPATLGADNTFGGDIPNGGVDVETRD